MQEDKIRWNEKYRTKPMPGAPSPFLVRHAGPAVPGGRALDIACGTGRHTAWLAEAGFRVDAVDLSDFALAQIAAHPNVTTFEADLDSYTIAPERYDLIVNVNYLDRRLFPLIRSGLKPGGLLIFETFAETPAGSEYHRPSDPLYVLQKNELLHAFLSLEILHYEERDDVNLRGEKVRVASLAARQRLQAPILTVS